MSRVWRHHDAAARRGVAEVAPRDVTPAARREIGDASADELWRALLVAHMPFHHSTEEEVEALNGALRAIIRELTHHVPSPSYHAYYVETFEGREAMGELSTHDLSHVVLLQLQLMEQAYFMLRLDRYANATDNHGWMNMFRRWATSAIFARFAEIHKPLLTTSFFAFYREYVLAAAGEPIERVPVPHPWDAAGTGTGPGVFLDSGIREAGRRRQQPPRAEPGQHDAAESKESPAVMPDAPAEGDATAPND